MVETMVFFMNSTGTHPKSRCRSSRVGLEIETVYVIVQEVWQHSIIELPMEALCIVTTEVKAMN
jgi:hypothetical protein